LLVKDVTSTEVDIFLLFASGCHLCSCSCLKSGSVNDNDLLLLVSLF